MMYWENRSISMYIINLTVFIYCILTPLSAIFQLHVYHVECTLFCNLQSRARTHAVLVIGLYELLSNPTT
jgi:hypothetical protein